jgi:macrolide transport system ATP-binding/permease protein
MSWIKRIGSIARRRRLERDLNDELQHHIELKTQENIEAGMTPEEARYAALKAFGGVEQKKEECRDADRLSWIEDLLQDIRFGARQLRYSPGFTAVSVITLALGIGLNTSIFTLYDAATLRALPVKDPGSVVRVYQGVENDPGRFRSFSYPEYRALRGFNGVFSGLIAYSWIPAELGSGADARYARGLIVSGNYFSVLGGEAAFGRTFAPEKGETPAAYPVLVLSHEFWQQRFNSDPSIVGKTVRLNGTLLTVVGIARQSFVGTEPQIPDFWAPLAMQPQLIPGGSLLGDRRAYWLNIAARLRLGTSLGQAQGSMNILIGRLAQEYLGANEKANIILTSASFLSRPDERGQVDSLAFLVMAAVGMILLIACANVASLVLARGAGRQKEISVRLSLGASRSRLIRQLLTESALLALLGGGAGLLLAWRLPKFLIALLQPPYEQPIVLHLGLDIAVVTYALVLSLITGVIFGLAPALQASKPNLVASLKDAGTPFGQQLNRSRFRSMLVVVETALCFVLLLGTGLLVRALQRAATVDPGFDTKHVLVVSLDLGYHGYDDNRAAAFHRQLVSRLQNEPGVKSVSVVSLAVLGGVSRSASITVPGKEVPSSRLWDYWVVSSNYFEALGIRVLRGRAFDDRDMRGAPAVAVINEAMARDVWPGENPVGKFVRLGPPSVPFAEVVGVVKNTSGARLWERNKPCIYLPLLLSAQGPPIQTEQLGMKLLIRTEGSPESVAPMVSRVVRDLDPNVSSSYSALEKSLGRWVWFSQVGAAVSGFLGLLAVLLAVVGLHGIVSYSVSQRTHEIGVRMAMGARKGDVLRLVVRQGMLLVWAGAGIGVVGGLALGHFLSSMLYGVRPTDPLTFVVVSSILTGAGLLACYIPARRAANVDPVVALRHE